MRENTVKTNGLPLKNKPQKNPPKTIQGASPVLLSLQGHRASGPPERVDLKKERIKEMEFLWRKRTAGFLPSVIEGPKEDLHQFFVRLEFSYFNIFVLGESQN
jgi:hypothetical protein